LPFWATLGNEQAEKVVEEIVYRLEETSEGLNLQKAIEQLRMLSNLRKLQPIVDTIMEHISTYFKIENDVLYIKGQRDALLKIEEKIREAEKKIREEQQKLYEEQQKRYEVEQQKLEAEQQKLEAEQQKRYEAEQQKRYKAEQQKLEAEQLIKQNQHDVVTNLIVSTNLPNETIANIANVTLSFVEDLRKTLTQK
jgi:multidrug efflux pump subunit AcrA (membrane-fusion protein)